MHAIRWKIALVALALVLVVGLAPFSAAMADDQAPPPDTEDIDSTPFDDIIDLIRFLQGEDGGAKMEGDGKA